MSTYDFESKEPISAVMEDSGESQTTQPVETDDFATFQNRECDEIEREQLPPVVCPTCIPNPAASVPVWWEETEPFLNQRDCLYQMAVSINEDGKHLDPSTIRDLRASLIEEGVTSSQSLSPEDIKRILGPDRYQSIIDVAMREGFLRAGIRQMLRFYDKLESNETVCAFSNCEFPSDRGPDALEKIGELLAYYSANVEMLRAWMDDPPEGATARELDAVIDLYNVSKVNEQKYRDLGKDLNFRALEWVATIDDFHIEFYQGPSGGVPIRFLLSIPAFNFDLVEDAPGEEEPVDDPANEVILDARTYDGQINRLQTALRVFEYYYAFFNKTEQGSINFKNFPAQKFQIRKYREGLGEFQDNLDDFLNNNGYRVPLEIAFGKDLVEEIKIKFDNSNPVKKYIVKRVSVKTAGCRGWTKIRKKTPKILNAPNKTQRTVMGFIANLDDIDRVLTARESPDWIDFLEKYTYPQISVNYGTDPEESALESNTALGCMVDDLGIDKIFDYLGDELLTLTQAISYNFNKKMCKTDVLDGNPEADERERKQEDEEEALKIYEGLVAKELRKKEKEFLELEEANLEAIGSTYSPEELKQAEQRAKETAENRASVLEAAYNDPNSPDSRELMEEARKLASGEISDEENYPFARVASMAALEKFNYEDSLINMIMGLFKKNGKLTRPRIRDIEELLAKMGACGLVQLLKKALQCLLGGMTLEAALRQMVVAALKSMTNDNLGRLFVGLPPDKQEEVRKRIENEFRGIPAPWDEDFEAGQVKVVIKFSDGTTTDFTQSAWNNLKAGQKDFWVEEIRGGEATAETTIENQGTIGKTAGNVQGILIEAYIEAMMETNTMEALMNELDKFPGAQLIAKIIADFACPRPPLFDPPISNFLSTLTLNVCDPTIGITWPRLRELRWPDWDQIFAALQEALIEAIRDMFVRIVMNLIYKLLVTLESILCKSLEAVGAVAADALNPWAQEGEAVSLRSAFRDAFCGPTRTDAEVDDTIRGALSSFGFANGNSSELADKAIQTISNVVSKNEILGLMVSNPVDHDPATLQRISFSVGTIIPEFADTLGDPSQISDLFTQIGDFINPNDRAQIQATLIASIPDRPINESICLTNEDFEQWTQDRIDQLTNAGLDDEEAADYVQGLNDQAEERLSEFVENLLNLDDAVPTSPGVQEIINSLNPNQGTDRDSLGESCSPNALSNIMNPRGNEEVSNVLDSLSNKLFDEITVSYVKDLIGGDFNQGGFLNFLLADTMENKYTLHNFLTRNFFTKWFYADSEKAAREQAEESWIPWPAAYGFFPSTIGKDLRDVLVEGDVEFVTTTDTTQRKTYDAEIDYIFPRPNLNIRNVKRSMKKPEFTLEYGSGTSIPHPIDPVNEDPIESGTKLVGAFRNGIAGSDGVKQNFNYRVTFSRVFTMGDRKTSSVLRNFIVERPLSDEETLVVSSLPLSNFAGNSTWASFVFRKFIDSRWNGISGYSKLSGDDLYDKINSKLASMAKDYIMTKPGVDPKDAASNDISSGFLFGYEFDDLETDPDYFTYVAPNGGDYEFDEEEAVLGKMKKKSPRVHILNPAIYGGKFSDPPFYIDPPERMGWLGILSSLIPDSADCSKEADILDMDSIKQRANMVASSMPYDERLNIERVCATEVPFDHIVGNSTHGNIEGTVMATIRIYLIEMFLLGMPAFANLTANVGNYDDGIFELVANNMKEGLPEEGGFALFSKIKRLNYWLLFLEQCVQIFQRKVDNGEVEIDSNVEAVLARIGLAQKLYKWPQKNATEYIRNHKRFDLPGKELDLDNINGREFYSYSLAYQAFDENIFKSNQEVKIRGSIIPAILLNQLRFSSKILTIRVVERECTEILKQLIKSEASFMFDKFAGSMKPRSPISNIQKYFMGLDTMFVGSTLRVGEASYLVDKQTEGMDADPGDIPHVISDPTTQTPLDVSDNYDGAMLDEMGLFVIEKYITVIDKPEGEDVPDFVKNRDKSLYGVVNLKDFQKFIDDNRSEIEKNQYKISDCFGSLSFIEGEEEGFKEGIEGDMGLKYGIRICYAPPSSFKGANVNRQVAMNNKAFNVRQKGGPHTKYIFPIVESTTDLLDAPLAEFSWKDSQSDPYDMECMVTKLLAEPEFKLFFDKLVPIRTYTSFVAMFFTMGFLDAFGQGEGERVGGEEDAPSNSEWDRLMFSKAKASCRRLFADLYTSNDFDPDESQDDYSIRDWIRSMNPFANVAPGVLTWWQRRNLRPNPTECQNPFMDLF